MLYALQNTIYNILSTSYVADFKSILTRDSKSSARTSSAATGELAIIDTFDQKRCGRLVKAALSL